MRLVKNKYFVLQSLLLITLLFLAYLRWHNGHVHEQKRIERGHSLTHYHTLH